MKRRFRGLSVGFVVVVSIAVALAPMGVRAAGSLVSPAASEMWWLEPSASIGGTVTHGATSVPLQGVWVTAWLDRGTYWENVASIWSNSNGAYHLQALAAGTYRIDFSHPDLVHEWYDDVFYPEQATNLPLAAGESLTGVDAELVDGGKIAGVVLEENTGAPPPFNIPVSAYRLEGSGWKEFITASTSVVTGRYVLNSLAAGIYRVKFDGGAVYATEYYDNAPSLSSADDIAVSAGMIASNVDARLAALPDILDEEIILLARDGRIEVRDPYTSPNVPPVVWQSPTNGWQQLAAGDFNGDGAQEILALRGFEARLFDPVVPGCTPTIDHTFAAPTSWQQIVTGDIDGDGRDELVLTYDLTLPSTKSRLLVFDSDPSGTQWIQAWQMDFAVPFLQFATGDLDGDGDDELAGIRNVSAVSFYQIVIWDPSDSWAILHEGNYAYEWTALAIGNTHDDPSGSEELVVSRNPGTAMASSYQVFRCCDGTALVELVSTSFDPSYTAIATGDVNDSGDEEVYLLRSGMAGSQPVVALTSRNYGNDSAMQFNQLTGETQFRQVAAGDLDGDARAEVVVSSADGYLQYVAPENSLSYVAVPGMFDLNGIFAVGDVDGPNESACGPIYLPVVLKP